MTPPATHYNYFRDYDPAKGGYVESDPTGLDGGWSTYAYVGGNPLSNVDLLGLIKKCIMRLMLVTAYDDKGPGRDWSYYKTHPDGVGPGTIATANTSPTPYPFGSTFDVLNSDGSVGYSGINHDTGAGWDRNHHNVNPKHWIDIWLPPSDGKNKHKNAMKWGKQWRAVKICTEECSNAPDDPDSVLPYIDLFQR